MDIVERLRDYHYEHERFPELIQSAWLEIERLRAVGNAAFFAMCNQRDNPDAEVFQDAIDALGTALHRSAP